jgi:hypothetical protein
VVAGESGGRKECPMAEKPKATVKDLERHRPPDTVRKACAACHSEATRAVYQHNCNPAVVTWEIPAYSRGKDQALVKWPCPLCKEELAPVLIKCGECTRVTRP